MKNTTPFVPKVFSVVYIKESFTIIIFKITHIYTFNTFNVMTLKMIENVFRNINNEKELMKKLMNVKINIGHCSHSSLKCYRYVDFP